MMCGTNFNYLKVRLLENKRADPPKVAIGKDCYQSEKKGKKRKYLGSALLLGLHGALYFGLLRQL